MMHLVRVLACIFKALITLCFSWQMLGERWEVRAKCLAGETISSMSCYTSQGWERSSALVMQYLQVIVS